MNALTRKEALALADKLESELRSDDPGLQKCVTLQFLDDSSMRIENAFIHKEGKWIIVLSEHHRALVYDDEEVEYSEHRYPTQEEQEAEDARAEEILAGTGTGNISSGETNIPIDFRDDIYWNVYAEKMIRPGETDPVIRMFWGWTAGLNHSELSEVADDSPKGEDYVYMGMEQAAMLRDTLNDLLEE